MPIDQTDGPTFGADTAEADETDAAARESRGEFVGKNTFDRLFELYKELKPLAGQPMTPDVALKVQEYQRLQMRAQEQQRKYPSRPGPFATGTTQDKKGDRSNVPQRLGGPEDEDDSPMQDIAKDVAAIPGAAFHALAMRPYNAAKTLASPQGQYQPGTGDEEGVRLGNQAAGALATGSLRGGGGLGAVGGKGVAVETMQAMTRELQKVTEAISAATQHLNALGAKKASGGFGKEEYASALKIQDELRSLVERGKTLEAQMKKARDANSPHTRHRVYKYGYDPATKKPGARAGGLPAPNEETLEEFQAGGNL